MIQRRTAVTNADKAGKTNVTQARLFDLQRYSASHMNASTGVIYLEYQYRRDTQKAVDKAIANEPDDTINLKVDRVCKSRYPGYSYEYTICFRDEAAKYPAASSDRTVKYPTTALYRIEYVSPLWSPDFAGFSLVVSGIIVIIIILRLLGLLFLRFLLRRHYKSI